MVILSLIAFTLAIKKKNYRYLLICILDCIYCIAHSIFRTPALNDTVLYEVLSAINIPLLLTMLIAAVWAFYKPLKNDKRCFFPIVFCAGIVANKIIRKVFFHIQAQCVVNTYEEGIKLTSDLMLGLTILDVVYSVLFCCMMISIIIILKRTKAESAS